MAIVGPRAHAALSIEFIASGFDFPICVAAPPGDTTRLFVVERGGTIRVIQLATKTVLPTPFIDVNDSPNTDVNDVGEGGLLSIAFHPNYSQNGYFFVYYTADLQMGHVGVFESRVSRFTVSADPNVADPASEVVFLELTQPFNNHNGGMTAFRRDDPNHYLYVSLGDGGYSCSQPNLGQDTTVKFASILRIDVDAGPSGDIEHPYAPPTNPFFDGPGGNEDLIWVHGLRNPYRFSFDRKTGDMYIGDVGAATREEISFQSGNSPGGENYGWSAFEGTVTGPCIGVAAQPGMVAPIYDYGRDDGRSVTGGYVYRGFDYDSLAGRYFFTDFWSPGFWSFKRNGGGITDFQDHSAIKPSTSITGFGEDARGELYFVTAFAGVVWRLTDPESGPVDSDGDGLPDEVETNTGVFVDANDTGTDPDNPDTDGDGVSDAIEVNLGTDPNDSMDFPILPVLRGWALSGVLAIALIASGLWFRRRRVARR